MKRLLPEEVNKRNSITWTACNDDSRAAIWRNVFVEKFGGSFSRERTGWTWKEDKKQEIPRKCWIFSKDNKEIRITHFSDYCKDNNLSRSAMYEVMNGKRKQHKGYTFVAEELNGVKIINLDDPKIETPSEEI